MAGLTNATKNAMLDTLATNIAYLSLHSADPGTTGTNELTGGSPAYARKAAAWAASASGSKALSASDTFDVPAGSTTAYVGYWTAVTGGTFTGSRPLPATESYTGQGTYTLTALTESLA